MGCADCLARVPGFRLRRPPPSAPDQKNARILATPPLDSTKQVLAPTTGEPIALFDLGVVSPCFFLFVARGGPFFCVCACAAAGRRCWPPPRARAACNNKKMHAQPTYLAHHKTHKQKPSREPVVLLDMGITSSSLGLVSPCCCLSVQWERFFLCVCVPLGAAADRRLKISWISCEN